MRKKYVCQNLKWRMQKMHCTSYITHNLFHRGIVKVFRSLIKRVSFPGRTNHYALFSDSYLIFWLIITTADLQEKRRLFIKVLCIKQKLDLINSALLLMLILFAFFPQTTSFRM